MSVAVGWPAGPFIFHIPSDEASPLNGRGR